jgi:hypothetical protein
MLLEIGFESTLAAAWEREMLSIFPRKIANRYASVLRHKQVRKSNFKGEYSAHIYQIGRGVVVRGR